MILEEKVLKQLLENEYRKGFVHGTKTLEERIISASQKGNPIELSDDTVVFIQSDIEHLHSIFVELEKGTEQ